MRLPEERPAQPWGTDPPPAPASASRREVRRVRLAWKLWTSAFRPVYVREGETVEASVDLKGNIYRGRAVGASDEDAAWRALQDCIDNWLLAVSIPVTPRVIWHRLRRHHRHAASARS